MSKTRWLERKGKMSIFFDEAGEVIDENTQGYLRFFKKRDFEGKTKERKIADIHLLELPLVKAEISGTHYHPTKKSFEFLFGDIIPELEIPLILDHFATRERVEIEVAGRVITNVRMLIEKNLQTGELIFRKEDQTEISNCDAKNKLGIPIGGLPRFLSKIDETLSFKVKRGNRVLSFERGFGKAISHAHMNESHAIGFDIKDRQTLFLMANPIGIVIPIKIKMHKNDRPLCMIHLDRDEDAVMGGVKNNRLKILKMECIK